MASDVTLSGLRAAKNLTQEGVAAAAGEGMDRVLYNKLEKGKRKLTATYAARLAPVLGPEVWDLVTSPAARSEEADGTQEEALSFGARLRALESRFAASEKRRREALQVFVRRLDVFEQRGQTARESLQAIHERLDALEAAAATRAPQGSPPASADGQT